MATFNINIQPIPPAWYSETFYLFPHATDCPAEIISRTYNVGVWQRGENVADTWIFANVEGNDNKFLKITNMYSTNPGSYYMQYNGVPIPNGSFEPDQPQVVIDISLVPSGYPIPGLEFVFLNHDTNNGGNISFQVSIERPNGEEGAWVYPRFNSQKVRCEPPPPPEIFQNSFTAGNCSSVANVRVEPAAGITRWVRIIPNDNYCTAAWEGPVTGPQNFDLAILGETGNYTTFSNVIIATYANEFSNTIIDSYSLARPHTGIICP